jgi:hypothetical protein
VTELAIVRAVASPLAVLDISILPAALVWHAHISLEYSPCTAYEPIAACGRRVTLVAIQYTEGAMTQFFFAAAHSGAVCHENWVAIDPWFHFDATDTAVGDAT